jgi:threonyl-tRNA synthetase
MNDAHIYCSEEQFESEFSKVIELYLYYFELFGIEKYQLRLSKHSKEGLGKKYVDNEALWIKTEKQVRDVLVKLNVPFVEVENEAAFYGPKIDVQIWSVIGREFTLATNQLDFAVPERFELTYTDQDGNAKTPICIHRAPLSTHERFIGFLIEHYAGAFPTWLSPVQVKIIPVAEVFNEYANELLVELNKNGFRAELDDSNDSLSKKVRNSETKKIPIMLIVGEKEVVDKTVTVRRYGQREQSTIDFEQFIKELTVEITI